MEDLVKVKILRTVHESPHITVYFASGHTEPNLT